jgi:hypothetical protein
MFGKHVTLEQMREMGLEKRVLGDLISQKLIDLELKKMNIYVSDERVREDIYSGKNFRNKAGMFDHNLFDSYMKRLGYTEKEFMDDRRRDIASKILFESISNGVRVAPLFVDILYDYISRPREVRVIKLPFSSIPVAHVDEKSLEEFYTQNKTDFQRPEYREIEYYILSKEHLEKSKDIEDRLAAGKTLKEISSEFALKAKILKAVDKAGLAPNKKKIDDTVVLDPNFLDIAFSTQPQEDSILFELKEGDWCAVHISSITPETIPPFEAIKAEVEKGEKVSRQKKEAEKIAREAIENLKEKKISLHDVASLHKQTIDVHKDVVRMVEDEKKAPFTPWALSKIMEVKYGSFGYVVVDDHALIISVPHPLPRDEDKKKKNFDAFSDRVDDVVGGDIVKAYMTNLEKTYGVEVIK